MELIPISMRGRGYKVSFLSLIMKLNEISRDFFLNFI